MPAWFCYRKSAKICDPCELLCSCSLSRHGSLLHLVRNNMAAEVSSTHGFSLWSAAGLALSEGAEFRLHSTSDPAGSWAAPLLAFFQLSCSRTLPALTLRHCRPVLQRQLEVRNLLVLFLSPWVIQSQYAPNCKLLLSVGLPRYSMFNRQLQSSLCYFVSATPRVHQGSRMCERLGVNCHFSNPGWRRYMSF